MAEVKILNDSYASWDTMPRTVREMLQYALDNFPDTILDDAISDAEIGIFHGPSARIGLVSNIHGALPTVVTAIRINTYVYREPDVQDEPAVQG